MNMKQKSKIAEIVFKNEKLILSFSMDISYESKTYIYFFEYIKTLSFFKNYTKSSLCYLILKSSFYQ